jgi:hypothetical protein
VVVAIAIATPQPTLAQQLIPPACRLMPPDSLRNGELVPSPCIGRTVRVTTGDDEERTVTGRLVAFDAGGVVLVRRGQFSTRQDTLPTSTVRDVNVLVSSRSTRRMMLGALAGLAVGGAIGRVSAGGDCEFGSLCATAGTVVGALVGTLGGMVVGGSFPEQVWRPIWRRATASPG